MEWWGNASEAAGFGLFAVWVARFGGGALLPLRHLNRGIFGRLANELALVIGQRDVRRLGELLGDERTHRPAGHRAH